jgi:hypothetical protein
VARKWWIAIVPAMAGLAVGALVMGLLVVKLFWGWLVPDLFPGAVAQGLVAQSISWITAFKLAALLAILAGAGGVFSAPRTRTRERENIKRREGRTSAQS